MNAIKLTGIVAAGALLASSAAFAGPKWTFVEGTYTQGNEINPGGGDSGDSSNDYFTFAGSYGFADMYHVQARYLDGSIGGAGSSRAVDFDGYEINFGVNPAITDDTDFVTNIYYLDLDAETIDGCGSCFDTDGYGAKVGLRSMITDKLEMSAYGLYGDFDVGGFSNDSTALSGNSTWAEIGGQYFWTDAFSVSLDAIFDGPIVGGTALRFGARWSF